MSPGPSRTATRLSCWWREAEVHSGARVGQEDVLGYVQTVGDGRADGKGGGLEGDGAEGG